MNPAAVLQFERMIGEYARWRAVPEKERSPAPAWWWGPAMELRNMAESAAGRMVLAVGATRAFDLCRGRENLPRGVRRTDLAALALRFSR